MFQFVRKESREAIVKLYKKLLETNSNKELKFFANEISKLLGFGLSLIRSTIRLYLETGQVMSPNKKKRRLNFEQKLDEFDKNAIRRKVHLFYREGRPTVSKVLQAVNDDPLLPSFSRTTLWRLLKELNFSYSKSQRNSYLTEREDLILWRRRYLRSIREYRQLGRPIYFLDETWVNAGDIPQKAWVDHTIKSSKDAFLRGLTTGAPKPTGKGKRLIVLHIGSDKGFVEGGLLDFESKKNTSDYHDEMNGQTFFDWFVRILPLLEENAVIVMDNAPYHSMKLEKVPTSSSKKQDVIAWLEAKHIEFDPTMLKVELLEIVKRKKPQFDKYIIDEEAKKHNKTVLRLPPYHCELNPIELVWSKVKKYVKENNVTFKIDDVTKLLKEGVKRVTAADWGNYVRHTIDEEKSIWELDDISEAWSDKMDPVVIQINGDCESSSDDDVFADLPDD